MLKINSKMYETKEVIKVEINEKVYSIPLMKYLKYKDIKKLMALNNGSGDMDMIIEIFSKYIPQEVLEDLSLNDLMNLVMVWKNVNDEDVDLGN